MEKGYYEYLGEKFKVKPHIDRVDLPENWQTFIKVLACSPYRFSALRITTSFE